MVHIPHMKGLFIRFIRIRLQQGVLWIVSGMLLLLLEVSASAQPQLRGYLENRLFLTFLNNDFAPSHLKNILKFGNYNRARVILSHTVSDNSSLTVAVDYFTYHGYLLQQLRQPGTGTDPTVTSVDQRVVIDRAYIRLYFSLADVTIGKQRISWGRSLLWSPFDAFNRVNFFEPQEEKFGVNAFRVMVPLGSTSNIEGVFQPDAQADKSSAGLRLLWNWYGMEFTTTVLHFVNPLFRQNIYGLDWKGDVGVGIWFEGAYFNEKPFGSDELFPINYFRWLIGMDYSFDVNNGLFLMAEYTHDESGEPDKDRYNYNFLLTGRRFLLARDYLYGSVQLQRSDLTTWATVFFVNLNDKSLIIMPRITYLIFPDSQLTLGTICNLAERGTEFNPLPANDPFNYLGNSVLYAWLKVFF